MYGLRTKKGEGSKETGGEMRGEERVTWEGQVGREWREGIRQGGRRAGRERGRGREGEKSRPHGHF